MFQSVEEVDRRNEAADEAKLIDSLTAGHLVLVPRLTGSNVRRTRLLVIRTNSGLYKSTSVD